MTDNGHNFFTDNLGGAVCGHFRLAHIVFNHQLDLAAEYSAFGVPLGNDQFGGLDGGNTVGCQVAGMGTDNRDLDDFRLLSCSR